MAGENKPSERDETNSFQPSPTKDKNKDKDKTTDVSDPPIAPTGNNYQKIATDALSVVEGQPSPTATKTEVVQQQVKPGELIDPTTGQLKSTGVNVATTTGKATTASAPQEISASLVKAAKSAPKVGAALKDVKAWVGSLSP